MVYCEQDGDTAVMLAAEKGHLEVVKVLVQVGVKKEKQNEVSIWR
jgi:ankyrin repeat protein